jgi:hypothetical protein
MAEASVRVTTVSIEPWSTVPPDLEVRVRLSQAVDARSAQAGIVLEGASARGIVQLDERGREATWTPVAPLPDGEYRLLVQSVVSARSQTPVASLEIPFVVAVAESRNRPYGQVQLHQSTATLRMSDRRYAVSKLLDPRTGERSQIAVDEQGATVDLAAIRREDDRRYAERHGKIHPVLLAALEREDRPERLPVAVWLAIDERPVNRTRFDLEDLDPCAEPPAQLLAYRAVIRRAQARLAQQLRQRFQVEPRRAMIAAPAAFLELTPDQIREVATLEEVAAVFLHETEGIDDLATSMAISHADQVVFIDGWSGAGVRVGVWEASPDVVNQLVIQAYFDPARPDPGTHARLVTAIIRNRQRRLVPGLGLAVSRFSVRGYAPSSLIYSANSYDTDALEWAVAERRCTVINQSFHRRSEAQGGDLSFDDILKDYLALHFPFPTIVQAAGNFWNGDLDGIMPPSDEYVNHKGYNSISVANHNDTATAIDGGSTFRNPTTPNNDRELPEIAANGDTVTAVGWTDGGTSFASPAVAGSVALLQQMSGTLKSWPEGCRAILLAGAVNVTGRSWQRDLRANVDASDGAGALDIEASGRIARSRVVVGNRGEERGWDVGIFEERDFDANGDWRHVYRITLPNPPFFTTSMRVTVALAWTAQALVIDFLLGTLWANAAPPDLDLFVYEGDKLVAWSASWDNSYEILDFVGKPGKTYTVRVHRASGTVGCTYGIAWYTRTSINPVIASDIVRVGP